MLVEIEYFGDYLIFKWLQSNQTDVIVVSNIGHLSWLCCVTMFVSPIGGSSSRNMFIFQPYLF